MIVTAFLMILIDLINWVVSVRPSWTLELPEALDAGIDLARQLNVILPVSETFLAAGATGGVLLAVVGFKWLIKLLDWIADVIP